MGSDLPKKIYEAKPSVILSIDNEYMTFQLMEHLTELYSSGANDLPRRHYYNRFVKDFKQWALKYFDFVHYTVPLIVGS